MKRTLIFAALVAATVSAQAVVLVNDGFEGYANGSLLSSNSPWLVDANPGDDLYTIDNTQAHSGTQSARFDTGPAGGGTWAYQLLGLTPGAQTVTTTVWIKMVQPTTQTLTSSFGLFAYDAGLGLVGGLLIRQNGTATVVNTSGVGTAYAGTVLLGQWNKLELELNYATSKQVARLNGVALGSALAFTETTLSDVDMYQSPTGYTLGYYDDYKIEAVPEPATMVALGLGVAALARKRRNK